MPVSIITDKLLYDYLLPWPAFVGIFFVLLGFLGLNLSEEIPFFKSTKYKATWANGKCETGEFSESSSDEPFISKT
jgi:hypothetical protein